MFQVRKKAGNKDDKTDTVTADAQKGDVAPVVALEDSKMEDAKVTAAPDQK